MIKNNNEKFILDMQTKYNNGKLISQREWQKILDDARSKDIIVNKTGYLKTAKLTEHFVGAEIDEFILLTAQRNTMFTTLLNIEEYLLFLKEGKQESVIESAEEAQCLLDNIFANLAKLKKESAEYLTEEL